MIKVLIVDDEPFIRQGLKILINWEQYGYEIVGEASNGLEAIKELETKEIDLIIADIKMPEMNGLELIEYVRGNMLKEVKFIVLSGYYEFEYAKKAIKCNVTDYILKPIQKDELIKVLCTFKDEYIKREELYAAQKIKDKVVYDGYLNEVIHGKSNNFNLEYIKNYNNFSDELRYIIVEINYHNECESISEDEKRKEQQIFYSNMALWLGDNYYNSVININQYTESYDIGFIYDKRLAKEKGMNESEYILNFKSGMQQIQKHDFFIYIGEKVNSIEEISLSYKSATVAKLFSDFSIENNITYYDEMAKRKELSCNAGKQYMDYLIHEIEDNNKEEIIKCVDRIYTSFREYKINLDIIKININYLLCNLINIAKELDSEINQEEVMQYISSVSFEQMISRGSANHLKTFSLEFAEYLSQLRQNSFQGILNQIDKEISEHYMEKLSLKYLSEKYYINSAYLGQIFKKQYSISFKDYLNAYRIEKAAELLKRSDDKIYKIAEKVGYNNTDYFINKFVQLKEKTPLQYRKQFCCR
ncbi:response regulator transcription factor [Clostridium beijerinckii]|uniref:Stage 0 sporulation protein A homolog n=1 Tax=Clostridium beijerinckii TaxID=1520 RepID=A0AAE5H177_CLOBE|nr:response regulator [Clostridium beijerinckii]NSB12535.1 two-component system response regulator YesN [Clostridium beijerinckii]OOM25093.1 putative response regulatory protein [Clostridium beijerinckii]